MQRREVSTKQTLLSTWKESIDWFPLHIHTNSGSLSHVSDAQLSLPSCNFLTLLKDEAWAREKLFLKGAGVRCLVNGLEGNVPVILSSLIPTGGSGWEIRLHFVLLDYYASVFSMVSESLENCQINWEDLRRKFQLLLPLISSNNKSHVFILTLKTDRWYNSLNVLQAFWEQGPCLMFFCQSLYSPTVLSLEPGIK